MHLEIGVVIGRFQTDELTEGHKSLIDYAINNYKKVLIIVGTPSDEYKPDKYILPIEIIKDMLIEYTSVIENSNVFISDVRDCDSSIEWSEHVDGIINYTFSSPKYTDVNIIGGRDSFIPYYTGKFETKNVVFKDITCSASERREKLFKTIDHSSQFRHGIMWALKNVKPIAVKVILKIKYKDLLVFTDCSTDSSFKNYYELPCRSMQTSFEITAASLLRDMLSPVDTENMTDFNNQIKCLQDAIFYKKSMVTYINDVSISCVIMELNLMNCFYSNRNFFLNSLRNNIVFTKHARLLNPDFQDVKSRLSTLTTRVLTTKD